MLYARGMRRSAARALGGAAALAGAGLAMAAAPEYKPRPEVEAVVRDVSPDRVKAVVDTLALFGTRHTLSDPKPDDRGIGAARRWIKGELERGFRDAGLDDDAWSVVLDSHRYTPDGRRVDVPVEVVNVVATLRGTMPESRDRLIYITGHYDSINSDVMDRTSDAPGANDDASGVAVLIELARVMADKPREATMVFMATAGEEQGLLGAKLHAQAAAQRGLRVVADLNNDIVGDPKGALAPDSDAAEESRKTINLYSEGVPRLAGSIEIAKIALLGAESDSPARQLARFIAEVARVYDLPVKPTLVFRNDRFLRGGDHSAFIEAGFPAAVRFTVAHEDYTRQHAKVTTVDGRPYGDLPRFVEAEYLANVARLNGAAAMCLANAPSPPQDVRIITAKLTTDTTLRWSKCPQPDVAGYEVVTRATTAPEWETVRDVGDTTEWTGDVNKDDRFFGVRAYDRDGYRSVVTPADAAKE